MNSRIKIIFIINSLAGGGAERVMSYLLNNLPRNNFDISLVTFSQEVNYDIPKDIDYYCLNKKNVFYLPKVIIKLVNLLRKKNYDLIVSFLTYTNIFVLISWLISGKKTPLVISERANPLYNTRNQRFKTIKIKLVSWLYPKANLIVAVSEGVKDNLINCFNVLQNKIKVIYNPIDIDKINRLSMEVVELDCMNTEIPIILSCGRLTYQKNYQLLVRTFHKLIDRGVNALLVVLGDGEERNDLEMMVKNLAINDKVYLIGFQKNPYKFMSRATVFVLSSRWEGFPNVLLEAMACGVPVISTDCPSGPKEIIVHGENGLLVPMDDDDRLAEAIELLIKNQELRNKMSDNARKKVEQFQIKKILYEWEKLFKDVIS